MVVRIPGPSWSEYLWMLKTSPLCVVLPIEKAPRRPPRHWLQFIAAPDKYQAGQWKLQENCEVPGERGHVHVFGHKYGQMAMPISRKMDQTPDFTAVLPGILVLLLKFSCIPANMT
jgi:hypothetical protein